VCVFFEWMGMGIQLSLYGLEVRFQFGPCSLEVLLKLSVGCFQQFHHCRLRFPLIFNNIRDDHITISSQIIHNDTYTQRTPLCTLLRWRVLSSYTPPQIFAFRLGGGIGLYMVLQFHLNLPIGADRIRREC